MIQSKRRQTAAAKKVALLREATVDRDPDLGPSSSIDTLGGPEAPPSPSELEQRERDASEALDAIDWDADGLRAPSPVDMGYEQEEGAEVDDGEGIADDTFEEAAGATLSDD